MKITIDKSIVNNVPHYIGTALLFMFLLIVMVDPTNSVFHKKDIAFIVVVAYNAIVYKPDFSKLPHIILMFLAVAIPWVLVHLQMNPMDYKESFSYFKSIAPIILLLWVRQYNLIKIAKYPVVLCCLIGSITYILIITNPIIENVVYAFMSDNNAPVLMSRRTILGVHIYGFYLKSIVSFTFVLAYYIYCVSIKEKRTLLKVLTLILLLFFFSVSGTRSTMLLPYFLIFVIWMRTLRNSKYIKLIMYPLTICLGIAFFIILFMAATETNEASNVVKYGHLSSYATLFSEHPEYLLLGQGPGTGFYSEGFHHFVYKTEWTYLELIRMFGVFSIIIVGIFFKPLLTFWKFRKKHDLIYSMFWAYLAYLLIAGTNPLLISSTGMITLLMAYSLEERIRKNETAL